MADKIFEVTVTDGPELDSYDIKKILEARLILKGNYVGQVYAEEK